MKTFKDIQPVLFACMILLISVEALSQGVGIGTDNPHPSAILDLSSDSAGILVPRMTGVQRDAIESLAAGLLVFVTDDSSFYYCTGAGWEKLGEGSIYLSDADDDTKIMVEQTPDDDVIRFQNAGTEYFRMENGRLAVENTGHSVFIGNAAGIFDDLSDNFNVFVGDSAGMHTTSGEGNVALGNAALRSNTTGSYNSAIGSDALYASSGSGNIAVGSAAMFNNTTGGYNSAIGVEALSNNTSGDYNVALGTVAMFNNTTGLSNTSLGLAALYSNATGASNVAVGVQAGFNTLADSSVFIGYQAGYHETGGQRLYIENSEADSTGALIYGEFDNDFLRVNGRLFPSQGITDADGDTRLLVENGSDDDTLRIRTGGVEHFKTSGGRLEVVNTGRSTFIGEGAGAVDDLTDNRNVFIGDQAGAVNTSGSSNTAVGASALTSNVAGTGNTALGKDALQSATVAGFNTAVGMQALSLNNNSYNSAVGVNALGSNDGNFNVALGNEAGQFNGGSSSVFLGFQAGRNEPSGSRLYIENSQADSAGALIYGEFDNDFLRVNGRLFPSQGITDADGDTRLRVDNGSDDDTLRIETGGVEHFKTAGGRLEVVNTGRSIFIGKGAGVVDDLTNNQNVFIGDSSGTMNISGSFNTALGTSAAASNIGGLSNTAIGCQALQFNVAGGFNTAVGDLALPANKFDHNTAIGARALRMNSNGYYNVAIGSGAGFFNGGTGSIFIGYNAGRNEFLSDRLYIENSDAGPMGALIYGEFNNNLLRVNGTLHVNGALDVNGAYVMPTADGGAGQVLSTDGLGNAGWVNQPPAILVTDADNDTQIQVEESADEDKIRFDMAGTEHFVMTNGRLDVRNTGASVMIGENAGAMDDHSDNHNVFIGFEAAMANTTGQSNVALGYQAMFSNTTGFNNTALGAGTLRDNSGWNNTAIGTGALEANTSGIRNTAVGAQSLRDNTTGQRNVAVGFWALQANETGDHNVAIGDQAGNSTAGSGSVFIGNSAGFSELGSNRLYIENSAAGSTNALIYGEFDNDYLRVNANLSIRNGFSDIDNDTKIQVEESPDDDIIRFDIAGNEKFRMLNGRLEFVNNGNSVFIGEGAGASDNFAANNNVFVGWMSGNANTSGDGNVAVGHESLKSNTTGILNVAVGQSALLTNTIGVENTALGFDALRNNTTGNDNTSIGKGTLKANTIGEDNVAVGWTALTFNTTGNNNTAVGSLTLDANTSGAGNTALGRLALTSNTVGNYNVALGHEAGHNSTGSGSVFIGYKAGYFETLSNKLYISNSDADQDNALIYGDFNKNTLNFNGNLFIKNISTSSTAFAVQDGSGSDLLVVPEDGDILMPNLPTGVGVPLHIIAGGDILRNTSTRRDKCNIAEFNTDFTRILQVEPRTYGRHHTPDKPEIGYIAEEFDSIGLHELVIRSESGQIEGLYYDKIVLYTNEVLKKHDAEIAALKEIVAGQQAVIEKQSALLDQLFSREALLRDERVESVVEEGSARD